HRDKCEYMRMLLPMLVTLRRTTGLPHKIVLDEAHHFLHDADVSRLIALDLAGYIFVTYRISSLPATVREITDAVLLVTRETDPDESRTLLAMCRPANGVSASVFQDLGTMDAALLPGAEEAHGQVRRFRLAPRLTAHVRHRTKYLDMPVGESQAFVFTSNGRPGPRARTLKEFIGFLASMPAERLDGHLRRHDFSRWIEDVFRDRALAGHLRKVETGVPTDNVRDAGDAIAQAIRARYETRLDDVAWAQPPQLHAVDEAVPPERNLALADHVSVLGRDHGRSAPGPALRRPYALEGARTHRGRRHRAGARHRSQYRNIQHRQRRPPAAPAVCRARSLATALHQHAAIPTGVGFLPELSRLEGGQPLVRSDGRISRRYVQPHGAVDS